MVRNIWAPAHPPSAVPSLPRHRRLRRHRRLFLSLGVALFALSPSPPAIAFGPGTHLREAQTYVEALEAGAGPPEAAADLALLTDPANGGENLAYFYMGAIFPDVGRRVDDMGFEPHRLDVLDYLLGATAAPDAEEEPLRAFVLGNALHATSDSAAQVFLVPYLTAATDVGVVDVLIGRFDGPGGENEFFVEAMSDVYVGDLHAMVDLYYRLTAWSDEPIDLHPVLMDYYRLAGDYLGELPLSPEAFADNTYVFLDELSAYIGSLAPEMSHRIVDDLLGSDPAELFEFLTGPGAAFFGLGGVELDPSDIDPLERARLISHPFIADPELYGRYDSFFGRLGSAFLRDWFAGATVFDHWRTWRGPPLLAASLQSLAWTLPESHLPNPDVLVWSLGFEDGAGTPLAAFDAQSPPTAPRLVASVFPATTRSARLRVQVRGDRPGYDWEGDPVLGEGEVELSGLPEGGAPPHRDEVVVSFSVPEPPENLLGFYGVFYDEALEDGSTRPYLVTLENAYVATDGADLTRSVWRNVFATSDDWQPYLPVAEPSLATGEAFLDVRLRNQRFPRQGVPGAEVWLVDDGDYREALSPNAVGRAVVGPLSPGRYGLSDGHASAFVWPADPPPVAALAGETTVLEAYLEPVPVIRDPGDYWADRERLKGTIDDPRFPSDQAFEAAVGREPTPPDSGWEASGSRIQLDLVPPAEDGELLYLFARAAPDPGGEAGPFGVSDGIVADGSPPEEVTLSLPSQWTEGDRLTGTVSAVDETSGIASYQASVASPEGSVLWTVDLPGAETAALVLDWRAGLDSNGSVTVMAVARNGAGLESAPALAQITLVSAPGEDVDGSGEDAGVVDAGVVDVGGPDAADAGEVSAPDGGVGRGGGGASDDEGCACRTGRSGEPGGATAPVPLWLLSLLFLLVLWSRHRRRQRISQADPL